MLKMICDYYFVAFSDLFRQICRVLSRTRNVCLIYASRKCKDCKTSSMMQAISRNRTIPHGKSNPVSLSIRTKNLLTAIGT
jgi:hypothetical protein